MDNKSLNIKLFNLIYKQNLSDALHFLKDNKINLLNLKQNNDSRNILHYSVNNKELFKIIFLLNPSLINEKNYDGESPLFNYIRKNNSEESFLKKNLTKDQLNIINNKGENILQIFINKKNSNLIKYCLNNQESLTDLNFYGLNRLNIEVPKRLYPQKLKNSFKRMKAGNFSDYYIESILKEDINLFFNKTPKKIKKLFFDNLNKSKEKFPHKFFNKALILKAHKDINIDLIANELSKEENYKYGYLNTREFTLGRQVLNRIYKRVSLHSFFLLLDDLFYAELKDLEYLSENLAFCEIPRKVKNWEDLREFVKKSILRNRNQQYKNLKLNQGIQILNDIEINDEFYISVPSRQEELIETSFILNMCVGNSLHYASKIKEFTSLIILLKRKKDNKVKYCLELSTKDFFKIIQAKGNFNKECPQNIKEETQKVIDSIMGRFIKDE